MRSTLLGLAAALLATLLQPPAPAAAADGIVVTPALVATVQNAIRWRAPAWDRQIVEEVAAAMNETREPATMLAIAVLESDLRFATDFAEAFFHAKKNHPGPVQLVLEEAQRFIPQRLGPGQDPRMLGAFEEIAEVGRNYGIGLHLISQRPQKLAKDVLNLADTVLAYRTNGVLERKALSEWVQEKGAEGRDQVQGELPGLARGHAIVWCPTRRIYGEFSIRLKTTYDAGATPITARAAVKIQPLDLGALEAAMGRAADEAKANDPRALKAEIARLRKELAAAPATGPERKVEVPVVPKPWREKVTWTRIRAAAAVKLLEGTLAEAREWLDALAALEKAEPDAVSLPPRPARLLVPPSAPRPKSCARAAGSEPSGDASVGNSGLRRMLTALAQRPQGLTNAQLGVRAGVSSKSGTFATYLSRARSQGWVADQENLRVITEDGLAALGEYDALPEGPELASYWVRELGGGASRMLQALVDAYPGSLSSAELGERAGISHASGTFATYLSRLRKLELVAGRGELRASEELV